MKPKNLVFGVLAAMLAVGLCGVVVVGFFYLRARWDPFPRSDLRMEGDWPLQRDDEIGFVAARNARTLRRHLTSDLRYHLFTDERGARVNTPGDQTPSRIDLLTIGCSFSWGHGVENEDTFTEGLRGRLGVRVANFAMGSYGSVHSLLLLRRHLDLRPRLIVYGFIDDHLRRNLSPCAPSYAPFCVPMAHVALTASSLPTIRPPKWEYFSAEQNRDFYRDVAMTDRFSFRDVLWRARVDLFRVRESRGIAFRDDTVTRAASMDWLMGQLAAVARRVDASLLVVYLPGLSRGEAGPPPRELVSAATTHGAILLDLSPRVIRHHAEAGNPSLVIPLDLHPSAAAHALIADELERAIRTQKLLQ